VNSLPSFAGDSLRLKQEKNAADEACGIPFSID